MGFLNPHTSMNLFMPLDHDLRFRFSLSLYHFYLTNSWI